MNAIATAYPCYPWITLYVYLLALLVTTIIVSVKMHRNFRKLKKVESGKFLNGYKNFLE